MEEQVNTAAVFEQYIDRCHEQLLENEKALRFLARAGITERFVLESFQIGYADGSLPGQIEGNAELTARCATLSLLGKQGETLRNRIVIPLLDEHRSPVGIVGISMSARSNNRVVIAGDCAVFNAPFLRNTEEIILTGDPLHSLLLIQLGFDNVTFAPEGDEALLAFVHKHGIKTAAFTFDGKERLFYELSSAGATARRAVLDFDPLVASPDVNSVRAVLTGELPPTEASDDTIQAIESGFIFRFPLLHYRVIGSFHDQATSMKVNIKAFTSERVFVDSVDLYKHRERERLVYNLMDRFDVRDQVQLEDDLTKIVEVIEKHKEAKATEKKRSKPPLTDYQQDVGMKLLTNPAMLGEIERDYAELGYVQERKNKLLLYLVMTSRLTSNPLHAIAISRSGAGKSHLAEITAELCPPEDLQSVSDLSAQALYYFGKDDLRHAFVVIGEKSGSDGADYPLRELISRKSITKAIPMKDPSTGQIRTESITVDGPIALVETTSSANVNPENLNRCFVLSIDESEEQTKAIHDWQRKGYTLEGLSAKRTRQKIIEKHVYAQRLLRKVTVVTPYAELLTFPSGTLRSRRDNEKLLRLISGICFLHQHQREVKTLRLSNTEEIEYIEATVEDYRIAYELLADGVLENTLDDLPRPARQLFDVIHAYLEKQSKTEDVPKDRMIFERKDIREFCSWSFAQVRNNMRILADYEYVRVVNGVNGTAKQYRLAGSYSDPDFMGQILTPEQLAKRIKTASKG
jgi:DNA primase